MECKCAKNTWNLHARGCHNYLAPIGIPIMVDESRLREQIAKEIVAYHNDPKSCHKDYRHCECEVYLAIARGEPNQVTKDAIEEARKMNGETLSDEKLAEIAGQVPHSDANNVRFL